MYKQKSGAMMRAGYNKDAESPFKNQNPICPNPFRTEEMMNLRENVQSMKKSKISGYVDKEKKKKYYTEVAPPEKSVAAEVLSSQREKFKSGPSLINKDQTTSLYSPDPVKKAEMEAGQYRQPGGLESYMVAERNDVNGNTILGKSARGFKTFETDKRTGRVGMSKAAKAMGKLDRFFQGGKF